MIPATTKPLRQGGGERDGHQLAVLRPANRAVRSADHGIRRADYPRPGPAGILRRIFDAFAHESRPPVLPPPVHGDAIVDRRRKGRGAGADKQCKRKRIKTFHVYTQFVVHSYREPGGRPAAGSSSAQAGVPLLKPPEGRQRHLAVALRLTIKTHRLMVLPPELQVPECAPSLALSIVNNPQFCLKRPAPGHGNGELYLAHPLHHHAYALPAAYAQGGQA